MESEHKKAYLAISRLHNFIATIQWWQSGFSHAMWLFHSLPNVRGYPPPFLQRAETNDIISCALITPLTSFLIYNDSPKRWLFFEKSRKQRTCNGFKGTVHPKMKFCRLLALTSFKTCMNWFILVLVWFDFYCKKKKNIYQNILFHVSQKF